jgi:hypothetical protein
MVAAADQRRDVEAFLVPVIEGAERSALAVHAFLQALGIWPGHGPGQAPVALSPDLLQKIGALVRIAHWERTGLRPTLRADLPAARDVLEDVVRGSRGFSGSALAQAVLRVHLTQLAWDRLPDTHAEVAVAAAVDPALALDAVAEFLWQFRHLATEETPP